MQTLYPPASKKEHPASRLPKVSVSRTSDPPSPCNEPSPPHDYVNFPSLSKASQGQRYVNVSDMLDDPAVQKARENYIKTTSAPADEPSYVNLRR